MPLFVLSISAPNYTKTVNCYQNQLVTIYDKVTPPITFSISSIGNMTVSVNNVVVGSGTSFTLTDSMLSENSVIHIEIK